MEDQRGVIIWINSVLIVLTLAAICSRVGRRVFVVGIWSWHDVMITAATISAFIFSAFQIYSTTLGFGIHMTEVPKATLPKLMKIVLASNTFYFLCNWAVKHALLLFYSEITRERSHLVSIYIMHFVAFGFGMSSILVNIFQCTPVKKAWEGEEVEGHCVNIPYFLYANASIMLTTDLVLYIMPVVFTWGLMLRRAQRVGLNFLFGLGGLVLAASGVRAWAVHKFAQETDFSWWFAQAMIWAVLENHLAIVVACAPSIKVIALLLFPRLKSSLSKFTSRLTPSSSSRTHPTDLESGNQSRKSAYLSGSNNRSRSRSAAGFVGMDSDGKLKMTPNATPLPSPASAYTHTSSSSRASRGFSKWFKSPQSYSRTDSLDDQSGLVYISEAPPSTRSKDVHLVTISKETTLEGYERRERERERGNGSEGEGDIRIEHRIEVESAAGRGSGEDEVSRVEERGGV
ncbi:hypothetical protein P154DRAFT_134427 [Amniculicola lignicola CBS 123094]|uniref:Rhodopsin domain-containing protein n=1 Tax=Amniculicola lignicola CBS 123094 TaxID=1392246 RepID=A0A6A5WYN1_9PLEO|nr:hypothetical protein P154DRAFT_134427 [Amniculicola lignicola CBS 123094]